MEVCYRLAQEHGVIYNMLLYNTACNIDGLGRQIKIISPRRDLMVSFTETLLLHALAIHCIRQLL